MDLLTDYAKRPVSFVLRYVRQRKLAPGRSVRDRGCRQLLGQHNIVNFWSTHFRSGLAATRCGYLAFWCP
jgi:hypothetical protein